jgi:hypothetical protein
MFSAHATDGGETDSLQVPNWTTSADQAKEMQGKNFAVQLNRSDVDDVFSNKASVHLMPIGETPSDYQHERFSGLPGYKKLYPKR